MQEATRILAVCGGQVRTLDPARPIAEAMLIRDGKVVAIGSQALASQADDIVDLGGRMAMPGIIDMHIHALEGARAGLYDLALAPTQSFEEIVALAGRAAATPGHQGWVVGGSFGPAAAAAMQHEAALQAFDAATGPTPVVLRDISYHSRFANSAALRRAGIGRDTPDGSNGQIVRDARTGNPTGLLHETAGSLVDAAMPAYTFEQDLAAARASVQQLNRCGVTGFNQAVASRATLAAYKALDDQGGLSARLAAYLDSGSVLALERDGIGASLIAARGDYATPRLRVDFAKFFMDGVPSMRTASFFEDYLAAEGIPAGNVDPFYTADQLVDLIGPLDRAGISVKIHAIGDRSIAVILDAIAAVRAAAAGGPLHQIAHMNFIRPQDIARLAELRVVADLCPAMWFPSAGLARLRTLLGAERADRSWPIRDIVHAGVIAAAGTDWPCIARSPSPWPGLAGMVTRKNPAGGSQDVHGADQRLDVATALRLFTINPAVAMGFGDLAGSLEVGKSADFIVLDRNLFEIPPEDIAGTEVLATFFESRMVHGHESGLAPARAA